MTDTCRIVRGNSQIGMDSDTILYVCLAIIFSGLIKSRTFSHSSVTLVNSLHCRAHLCILIPVLTTAYNAIGLSHFAGGHTPALRPQSKGTGRILGPWRVFPAAAAAPNAEGTGIPQQSPQPVAACPPLPIGPGR